MPKKNNTRYNLVGQRIGRLIVLNRSEKKSGKHPYWRCLCDCGQEKDILQTHLVRGLIKSCGCLMRECRNAGSNNRTHGLSRIPEYKIWLYMWKRCKNPNDKEYHNYGGRGITVCERWKDFALFYADVGPRPSSTHQIDRYPNNNGNYEPGNVRWATPKENARNMRVNVYHTFRGQRGTLGELCEQFGKDYAVARNRIGHGWTIEEAMTLVVEGNGWTARRLRRAMREQNA